MVFGFLRCLCESSGYMLLGRHMILAVSAVSVLTNLLIQLQSFLLSCLHEYLYFQLLSSMAYLWHAFRFRFSILIVTAYFTQLQFSCMELGESLKNKGAVCSKTGGDSLVVFEERMTVIGGAMCIASFVAAQRL